MPSCTPIPTWPTWSLSWAAERHRQHGHRVRVVEADAERKAHRRPGDRAAAREAAEFRASTLFLQSEQDVRVGGRGSRTQYQYTLEDADLDELRLGAAGAGEAAQLPELKDVDSDQQSAAAAHVDARPRYRLATGHHAASDRRRPLRCLRAAPGRDHLHRLNYYRGGAGGDPRAAERPRRLSPDLRASAAGAQVPLSTRGPLRRGHDAARRSRTRGSSRPSPCPSTWRPSVALGQRRRHRRRRARLGLPSTVRAGFRERPRPSALRWPTSPCLVAGGAVRRLHRPGDALREPRSTPSPSCRRCPRRAWAR